MKFDLSPADFLIWLLASFFIKTASRPSFSSQSRSGTYGPQRPARALSEVTIASRELLRALLPGPINPTVLQVLSNGPGLIGPFVWLFRSGSLVLFWLYYIPNSFVGVLFPGVCWVLFSEITQSGSSKYGVLSYCGRWRWFCFMFGLGCQFYFLTDTDSYLWTIPS